MIEVYVLMRRTIGTIKSYVQVKRFVPYRDGKVCDTLDWMHDIEEEMPGWDCMCYDSEEVMVRP